MKNNTPKTVGDSYTADEFNDFKNSAQDAILATGQTLTATLGEDNRQGLKAIAVGGELVSRGDGETAVEGELISPDNSGGSITIDLPVTPGFIGTTVDFRPVRGQLYSVNSLTVGRSANDILSLSEDFVMDSTNADNQGIRFVWEGGSVGWNVLLMATIAGT